MYTKVVASCRIDSMVSIATSAAEPAVLAPSPSADMPAVLPYHGPSCEG